MNKVGVLIIEDEMLFANNLEEILLQLYDDFVILGKIRSVEHSVEWFKTNKADLIFMDIHLLDGLCFEILNKIKIDTPIIFITAYDQYAIQAFKHNSIDYIIKPPKIDEIKKAIEKFRKQVNQKQVVDYEQLVKVFTGVSKEFKQRFVVHIGKKIKMVEVRDISYFYVLNKDCYLCTQNNKHYPIDFSLDKLESILDPELFFRINRNYIININSIVNMHVLSKSRIKIDIHPQPEEDAIVSLSRCSNFRKWINK